MKQEQQKQAGYCLGTFCIVALVIIVLALAYGAFMGVLNCF